MAFLETKHMFEGLANKPTTLLEMVEANRLKNQQNQQNEMALRKQKQSVDFDEQNNPLKLAKAQFDNMSEQGKLIEQELLQASIESTPFIDNKDSQNLMQLLQTKRNKLAQNGLRTDEIDNAIQLAQQGDFDTLKKLTGSQIQGAKALGLFQDNSQNLPAGIQYHQKLEEGRQMMRSSDPQVREQGKNIVNDLRQVLKIEKIGPNMTLTPEGGVENMAGANDAIYEQEDAKQRAKIPTAGVIAGIDVDKANQIDKNKSLPPAVQKQIAETTTIINNTSRIVDRGIELHDKIKDGTLNLGLVTNAINNAKNGLGISTEQSKALSELRTYTEELANNILSAAKGPQSDGDAVRAKNIILSGDADETIVREQLARLIKANDDIIKEQELALETQYRQNNKSPDAYKPQPQQSNQAQERIRTYNPQTGNFE